jgi:copper(I)-binding protein
LAAVNSSVVAIFLFLPCRRSRKLSSLALWRRRALSAHRVIMAGEAGMKKLRIVIAGSLLAGLLATVAAADSFKAGDIEIGQAYVRAMVPGAKVGGGYLTLTNSGSTDDKLTGIASDRARSAEVHQMSINNGVMTMRPVSGGLTVAAGETVELKPGGYHVMFMDVAKPFKEGEMVKARLTFEKAGSVDVEFTVGNVAGTSAVKAADSHSDMGDMDMSKPQ